MHYLDDTDSGISYSNKNSGTVWSHSTLGSASPVGAWEKSLTYAFNNTISVNFCQSSDGCQMQIVFTGTGITLYVIQIANYGNSTVSLDGGEAAIKTLPYRSDPTYNITLYDVQSLTYGNHYVVVDMQDWTGGGSTIGSLIFDYAAVSDTVTVETSSPVVSQNVPSTASLSTEVASASTSLPTNSGSTSSPVPLQHSHIGAIGGGTAGGIALIAIVIGILVFFRRKRAQKSAQIEPYPAPGLHTSTFRRSGNVDLKPPFQHGAGSIPIVAAADAPSSRPPAPPPLKHLNQENSVESSSLFINSQSQTFNHSAGHSHTASQSEASARELEASPAPPQIVSHPASNFSDSQLTDEQIDFVRGLWNANVPAADIARMIERMKNRVSGEDLRSGVVIGDTNISGAPPSYDSLRR